MYPLMGNQQNRLARKPTGWRHNPAPYILLAAWIAVVGLIFLDVLDLL